MTGDTVVSPELEAAVEDALKPVPDPKPTVPEGRCSVEVLGSWCLKPIRFQCQVICDRCLTQWTDGFCRECARDIRRGGIIAHKGCASSTRGRLRLLNRIRKGKK